MNNDNTSIESENNRHRLAEFEETWATTNNTIIKRERKWRVNTYKMEGRKFSKHGFNKREKGSGPALARVQRSSVTKAYIKATERSDTPNFRGNCGRGRGRNNDRSKQWTLVTGMNRIEAGWIIRINEWWPFQSRINYYIMGGNESILLFFPEISLHSLGPACLSNFAFKCRPETRHFYLHWN